MAEEDTKMETEEEKQETPVAAEEAYVVFNFFLVSRAHTFPRKRRHFSETTIFLTRSH